MVKKEESSVPYVYKCPNEGIKCEGRKHCHVLETTDELPLRIKALIPCPLKKAKIEVEIGN